MNNLSRNGNHLFISSVVIINLILGVWCYIQAWLYAIYFQVWNIINLDLLYEGNPSLNNELKGMQYIIMVMANYINLLLTTTRVLFLIIHTNIINPTVTSSACYRWIPKTWNQSSYYLRGSNLED